VTNEQCSTHCWRNIKEQTSRSFIDAWHRAERGETFHERHLAFENWDTLARVLTGKRVNCLAMFAATKSPAFVLWPRHLTATTVTFMPM